MEKLSFKAGEIEGPLDLILTLIAKHKLNIYDIEISKLVEQYVAYIEGMKQADLEVGSEFVEMAARLVYIKTAELLPKHEKTEELKKELTGQLLEYQACRRAAMLLDARSRMGDVFTRFPQPMELDETYRLRHSSLLLADNYLLALGRGRRNLPPPTEVFTPIVAARFVSVGSRIVYILKNLYRSSRTTLSSLFEQRAERSELVATFLALLELVKDKRVRVDDEGTVEITDYREMTEEELAAVDREFSRSGDPAPGPKEAEE
ncbi:MAG: segregation/condensation protein A [Clostridiales bacterium]|nr:segregation/condensation protein A [Clostridiales bacterium]